MNQFALTYLIGRLGYRISAFVSHWYWDGLRSVARRAINTLEILDRAIALRVTLRHFFEPLYGDHTVLGHILGLVMRSARVVAGVLIYPVVIAAAAAAYVVWAAAPLAIISWAFVG